MTLRFVTLQGNIMLRTASAIFLFLAASSFASAQTGVLPVGADGKPLNLDFETGTLKDWTADGKAFDGQPIKGDVVAKRRADSKSQHQGDFWIGGFEKVQDKPLGTLTSVPFKVTHPWATFLVGGGPWMETCVELVFNESKDVFYRASGLEEENLRPVLVDLQKHQGKEIFIRIVDKHPGHWGHINFDDFRFHEQKPKIPTRPKMPTTDVLKFAGLTPQKAALAMTVPEGFDVTLFAGEPDVMQPIAFCFDDRGRIWVAEAYSYPIRRKDKDAKDRILIFEDTDGDGKFDKRTVFMDGLNLVSGIEYGFGGIWIGAAPHFMFVPIKEVPLKVGAGSPDPAPAGVARSGDRATTTVPAGPPQILLDGWGYQDTHETLNTFIWGPDGWLYGCHGVFTHSKVGKPGTPEDERTKINAGVWRYHPTKHKFEVFAHGTSNPWGLDFNDYGQAFVECCVIPHNFHMIQGGRYQRQGGTHFNPHTYGDIKTIADHLHYLGATPHGGNERSDSAGGGHAHCGTMIYLGGTWPAEYRGQMFMGNIHGRRLNVDILKPQGSGYVASHGKDFLFANDAWARFINLRYGPDGNVYLIDWYDKQACHTGNVQVWDRTNGRIYKVSHRAAKPVLNVDLSKLSAKQLIDLQTHPNDWYVRHSRRILQERHLLKGDLDAFQSDSNLSRKQLTEHKDETKRLRGLWLQHSLDGLSQKQVLQFLADPSDNVRHWAVRSWSENAKPDRVLMKRFVELASKDPSPVVRLSLASALQRMDLDERWEIAAALLAHSEDVTDHNLPLMYWYAIEPLADVDPARALALALNGKIPQLHGFMIRRIGAGGDATNLLIDALAKTKDASGQLVFLTAMREALKGRRQVPMPGAWPKLYDRLRNVRDHDVNIEAACLSVTFGNPGPALEMLKYRGNTFGQAAAANALIEAGHPKLAPDLHWLLDSELKGTNARRIAIRGLATYDDAATPGNLIGRFTNFTADERRDALNTLAARPAFAKAMLDAVAAKKLDAKEVSADIVRQMRNLKDKELSARLTELWGAVRESSADRVKLIADTKAMLATPAKFTPDLAQGRAIFNKTCAQCHTLFGEGGKLAPDLTGSNRANLDYLLENILDPSAVIPKEYAPTVIEMKDGRILMGMIRSDTPIALTVVTVNEVLTLPRKEVDTLTPTKVSLMPEDLIKQLSEPEVRALIGYLQSPVQVPIKGSALLNRR